MGINPRDISRVLRRQAGLPFGSPAVRAKRTAAVPGSVGCWLQIRVPTVGLHAKGRMVGKRFCAHADREELRRAKKLYATALPLIPAPIAGPLRLHVDFVLEPAGNMDAFEGVLPFTGKPDRSNLLKVFEDALRRAGWMTDDSLVVEHAGGKWVSFDRRWQGVWFVLQTISPANDSHHGFCVPIGIPAIGVRPSHAYRVGRGEPVEHR